MSPARTFNIRTGDFTDLKYMYIRTCIPMSKLHESGVCFHRWRVGLRGMGFRIISRKHIRERINIFLMRTEYTSQVRIEVRGEAITDTYRIIHDPFIDRIIRNRTNRKDLFLSILQFILDRTIAVGDTCSYGQIEE